MAYYRVTLEKVEYDEVYIEAECSEDAIDEAKGICDFGAQDIWTEEIEKNEYDECS